MDTTNAPKTIFRVIFIGMYPRFSLTSDAFAKYSVIYRDLYRLQFKAITDQFASVQAICQFCQIHLHDLLVGFQGYIKYMAAKRIVQTQESLAIQIDIQYDPITIFPPASQLR